MRLTAFLLLCTVSGLLVGPSSAVLNRMKDYLTGAWSSSSSSSSSPPPAPAPAGSPPSPKNPSPKQMINDAGLGSIAASAGLKFGGLGGPDQVKMPTKAGIYGYAKDAVVGGVKGAVVHQMKAVIPESLIDHSAITPDNLKVPTKEGIYGYAKNAVVGGVKGAVVNQMKGVIPEALMDPSITNAALNAIISDPTNTSHVANTLKGAMGEQVKTSMFQMAKGMFSSTFAQYMPALVALQKIKEIIDRNKCDPGAAVNETASYIPNLTTVLALITTACQIPALAVLPYVGPTCLFLMNYNFIIVTATSALNLRSNNVNGECLLSPKDFSRLMSGDEKTRAEIILGQITCKIDREDTSDLIVITTVQEYGATLKAMTLLTKACRSGSSIQSDPEYQPACEFVNEHENEFKAIYEEYLNQMKIIAAKIAVQRMLY